jgi:hypothetical protein
VMPSTSIINCSCSVISVLPTGDTKSPVGVRTITRSSGTSGRTTSFAAVAKCLDIAVKVQLVVR